MIDELKKYLKETPIEDLVKEWMDENDYSKSSPSVDQLIEEWSCFYDNPESFPKVSFEEPKTVKNRTDKDSKFVESFFCLNLSHERCYKGSIFLARLQDLQIQSRPRPKSKERRNRYFV